MAWKVPAVMEIADTISARQGTGVQVVQDLVGRNVDEKGKQHQRDLPRQ